MNELILIQTEFLRAFLVTLLHSLWIGGVIFLLMKVLIRITESQASVFRYGVTMVALMLFLLFTLFLFTGIYQPEHAKGEYATLLSGTYSTVRSPAEVLSQPESSRLYLVICTIYVTGVLYYSIRLLFSGFYIRKMIRSAIAADEQYMGMLDKVRGLLGIGRHVELYITRGLSAPALFGIFKPVILVPAGMFTHLSFEQAEAILLHELAHLKRYDFIVNLLQHLIEALFFFNPFVWLISSEIRAMREEHCDDLVVRHTSSAGVYVN